MLFSLDVSGHRKKTYKVHLNEPPNQSDAAGAFLSPYTTHIQAQTEDKHSLRTWYT